MLFFFACLAVIQNVHVLAFCLILELYVKACGLGDPCLSNFKFNRFCSLVQADGCEGNSLDPGCIVAADIM